MPKTHQPDQAVFRSVLPEDVVWEPFAAFPPSARLAVSIGRGEQFDEEKLEAYPPGSVVVLPGDTPHFHWAKSGDYVTLVTAIGPISLHDADPQDDTRN